MFDSSDKLTNLKDIKPKDFIKGSVLVVLIVGILVTLKFYVGPVSETDLGFNFFAPIIFAYSLIGFISGLFFPKLKYMIPSVIVFMLGYAALSRGIWGILVFTGALIIVFLASILGGFLHDKFFPTF